MFAVTSEPHEPQMVEALKPYEPFRLTHQLAPYLILVIYMLLGGLGFYALENKDREAEEAIAVKR